MSEPSDLDKLRQMTGAPDVDEPLVSEDAFADIEVHSERPTWKLPLPKLTLVGVILVPVFGLAGYFLLAGGRQSESSVASTPTTEPDTSSLPPETDPALQQARSEIAGLKARMALADQAYVQQQSRAAQTPKPSSNNATTQAQPKPSAPEASTRPVSSTTRSSSPAPTVRYQPPEPQIRTAAASAPSPSPPNPQFSQVDPTERWQQLARLGSYGAMAETPLPMDEGGVAERTSRTATVATVPSARTAPTSAVAALPKSSSPPRSHNTETAILTQTIQPAENLEEVVLTGDANLENEIGHSSQPENDFDLSPEPEPSPDLTNEDETEIAQTSIETDDSPFLEDAEALILQESSQPQSLIAGAHSSGHLATPVILDSPDNSDRYLVVMTEPLIDNRGQVAIPAGSEVVIQVDSVAENRLVELSATEVVWEEQGYQREIILPERVIQVRGEGGNPLVAQQFEDRGGEIAVMDAGQFALGAVRRTAELYTRSSSRVQTGDGTTVITEENPAPNILAGALEGGTDAILDTITERNQQAIEDMRNRPNIRYLAAGTPVQVFVNESMQMPL